MEGGRMRLKERIRSGRPEGHVAVDRLQFGGSRDVVGDVLQEGGVELGRLIERQRRDQPGLGAPRRRRLGHDGDTAGRSSGGPLLRIFLHAPLPVRAPSRPTRPDVRLSGHRATQPSLSRRDGSERRHEVVSGQGPAPLNARMELWFRADLLIFSAKGSVLVPKDGVNGAMGWRELPAPRTYCRTAAMPAGKRTARSRGTTKPASAGW